MADSSNCALRKPQLSHAETPHKALQPWPVTGTMCVYDSAVSLAVGHCMLVDLINTNHLGSVFRGTDHQTGRI